MSIIQNSRANIFSAVALVCFLALSSYDISGDQKKTVYRTIWERRRWLSVRVR